MVAMYNFQNLKNIIVVKLRSEYVKAVLCILLTNEGFIKMTKLVQGKIKDRCIHYITYYILYITLILHILYYVYCITIML